MKVFMVAIRWFLGKVILTLDALFPARPEKRVLGPERQSKLNEAVSWMTLYQFEACPFCVKVRRASRRLGLSIQTRDAKPGTPGARELFEGGGALQVPCLLIRDKNGGAQWMYESSKIISYLEALTRGVRESSG
jgi:glutaredoxin